jgi:hypothetical protein
MNGYDRRAASSAGADTRQRKLRRCVRLRAAAPSTAAQPHRSPARPYAAASGAMFWFNRNTFVGSYSRLSASSRAYVSSP